MNQDKGSDGKARPGGTSLMATQRFGAGATWYVDSGASENMCSDRSPFTTLVKGGSSILLGDNSSLAVEGVGDVKMSMKRSNQDPFDANVTNVHYVPSLKTNLLSVSALLKKGCDVRFDQNGCHISRYGETIGHGQSEGNLFRLELVSTPYALAIGQREQVKPLEVWHRRFRHLGISDVKRLETLTTGMQIQRGTTMTRVCGPCMQGKQHRTPSRKPMEPAKQRLELIHTDVGGQITPSSARGARYYVTFTDNYTRATGIYFMKTKGEALVKLKEWVTRIEREAETKVKRIRSDNGGEYDSNKSHTWYRSTGIQ
jgi:hypothetical protein